MMIVILDDADYDYLVSTLWMDLWCEEFVIDDAIDFAYMRSIREALFNLT